MPDELTAHAPSSPATPADTPRPALPRTRHRARWLAGGAALVAAAVVAIVAWPTGSDDATTKGPLRILEPSYLSLPVHLGKPAAFGLPVFANDGDQDVVLESIAPVDPLPGTTVISTYASGNARRYQSVPATRDWPSKMASDLHPVDGFRVPPVDKPQGRRGTELIIVFRADRPGRYGFSQVRVDYRVGSHHYVETFLSGFAFCPVRAIDGGPRCPQVKPSQKALDAA